MLDSNTTIWSTMLQMLNSTVYVLKRTGKKTTSKPNTKCVFAVFWKVGKSLVEIEDYIAYR